MAKDSLRIFTAMELATVTGIALPTVSKILKMLVKAKVLNSTRGSKGGYTLADSPERITVAQVISVLEGPIALTECSISHKTCEQASGCGIQGNWGVINQAIFNALESVTLADMIRPIGSEESIWNQEKLIPINTL